MDDVIPGRNLRELRNPLPLVLFLLPALRELPALPEKVRFREDGELLPIGEKARVKVGGEHADRAPVLLLLKLPLVRTIGADAVVPKLLRKPRRPCPSGRKKDQGIFLLLPLPDIADQIIKAAPIALDLGAGKRESPRLLPPGERLQIIPKGRKGETSPAVEPLHNGIRAVDQLRGI